MSDVKPVILCGGSGTRLWPMSREDYPKQFIKVLGEKSLFQETLLRAKSLCQDSKPLVICNDKTRFIAAEQAQVIDVECEIMLEPVGRNTAPAIALAAFHSGPESVLFVMPADHVLEINDNFHGLFNEAVTVASDGHPVTFGIKPTKPETGYGYIKHGVELTSGIFNVSEFVEKPDLKTAESYFASGDYCWNSGMFLFHAKTYLNVLKEFESEVFHACENAVKAQTKDLDFIRIPESEFAKATDISVDYAVMEKVDNTVCVPLDIKWSDVGSWDALKELGEADSNGNVLIGDVIQQDSTGCYVNAQNRLIATLGLKDLVIIDTEDALLISDHAHAQNVKSIVAKLKSLNRPEFKMNVMKYKPWGSHRLISKEAGFEVREVCIHPGKGIRKQKHRLRSEHWVVTQGVASICIDDEVKNLNAGESCFVPAGCIHDIKNETDQDLVFIEVQIGEQLDGEDIERFD